MSTSFLNIKPSEWASYALILVLMVGLWWEARPDAAALRGLEWKLEHAFESDEVDWLSRTNQSEGVYKTAQITSDHSPHVHAATALTLEDGGIVAFWYGGSREGGKDVQVFQSSWRPGDSEWANPKAIINPPQVSHALHRYVKKIGNPLVVQVPSGDLWLTFVTVSVGGWAGSQLNWMSSSDGGQTWSEPKRWVTSPFFNVSTLVKSPAQQYTNGWVGIPIYHEFIGKFGEYLVLNNSGDIVRKVRMGWGRDNLQPLVLPSNKTTASVYLRYAGEPPYLLRSSSSAASGLDWQALEAQSLPNPNASVAGLALSENEQLLVFNNSVTDRRILSLAYTDDRGKRWKILKDIEPHTPDILHGFSYPVLLKSRDTFHLLYSWNRKRINHVSFDQAWLANMIMKTEWSDGHDLPFQSSNHVQSSKYGK